MREARRPRAGWLPLVGVALLLPWIGCSEPPRQDALGAAASKFEWPDLPASGFISGRAATEEDVRTGDAVFVAARDGRVLGIPLSIAIPQYAMLKGADGPAPVIIVQAERAEGLEMVGYLDVRSGASGIGKLEEVELLGTTSPSMQQ